MDGLGVVIIIVIGFIINAVRGARKVYDSRPGQSGRPAEPQRTVLRPQPEIWRQLGQMLESAVDTFSGEAPARQMPPPAPADLSPKSEEGAAGREGSGCERPPLLEGSAPGGAPAAQPMGAAAAPAARPMFTARELRKGVILSEILNRPTGRVRRWQPK